MAGSKKPRKKYNANAGLKNLSDKVCKNSFVFSVIGLGKDGTEWVKNNVPQDKKTTTSQDFDLMLNRSRPWSFVFGVACRDQLGQGYIKYEYQALSNQFAFTDSAMSDYVNGNLDAMLNDVNQDHVLSPFFLASPEKKEFSDDYIKRLLKWKRVEQTLKTPFEIRKLKEKGLEELRKIDPIKHSDKGIWTILRKHGINDFADIRVVGLTAVQQIKGIGEKRIKQLADCYIKIINEDSLSVQLSELREFEKQIYMHQESMMRLARAATIQ